MDKTHREAAEAVAAATQQRSLLGRIEQLELVAGVMALRVEWLAGQMDRLGTALSNLDSTLSQDVADVAARYADETGAAEPDADPAERAYFALLTAAETALIEQPGG